MFGKAIVASGGAYYLTFEVDVLPQYVGLAVLFTSGSIIVTDIWNGGIEARLARIGAACARHIDRTLSRMERDTQLRIIAAKELERNCGIRMPAELQDDDREWLREQAALAVQKFERG